MINKFEQEIDHERVSAERLHCENSILRRRIGKTMDDINGLKERVSSLLHQDEEAQKEIRSREEERQKLAEVKSKKDKDLASKNNAVIRLNHINHQLIKSHEIDLDKVKEMEVLLENGPLPKEHERLRQEYTKAAAEIEEQTTSNEKLDESIANLKESTLREQQKVAKLQNKVYLFPLFKYDILSATEVIGSLVVTFLFLYIDPLVRLCYQQLPCQS